MDEIYLSPKKSCDLLNKRLRKDHPNATPEELDILKKDCFYLRLETYDECLAKFETTLYIGEATNDYILNLLTADNLLNQQEVVNYRYVPGGDPTTSSVAATEKIQNFEKGESSR